MKTRRRVNGSVSLCVKL